MFKKYMLFAKEYLLNVREVGSLFPSSKTLSRHMTDEIDWKKADVIVEAGAGAGIFTERIMLKKKQNALFIVFEINPILYEVLQNKYICHSNIVIVKEDISHLKQVLEKIGVEKVDVIFSTLPIDFSEILFRMFQDVLRSNGQFRLLQSSMFRKNMIQAFFNIKQSKLVLCNAPPTFVFQCEKRGRVPVKVDV